MIGIFGRIFIILIGILAIIILLIIFAASWNSLEEKRNRKKYKDANYNDEKED